MVIDLTGPAVIANKFLLPPEGIRPYRLVLDLASRAPYRIVEASDGVKVVFGEGREPAPAPLAALRTADPDAAAPSATAIPVPATGLQVFTPNPGASPAALAMPVLPEPQLAASKVALPAL